MMQRHNTIMSNPKPLSQKFLFKLSRRSFRPTSKCCQTVAVKPEKYTFFRLTVLCWYVTEKQNLPLRSDY